MASCSDSRPLRAAANSSPAQLPSRTVSSLSEAMKVRDIASVARSRPSWSGPIRLKVAAAQSSIRSRPTLGRPTRWETACTGRKGASSAMASNSPRPFRATMRSATIAFRSARASRSLAGASGRITVERKRMCSSPSDWMTFMPLGALNAALKPTPSPLISTSWARSAASTSAKRPSA